MPKSLKGFILSDDNKLIHEKAITWIKKMDDCLYVCTKSDGCYITNMHKICQNISPESFQKYDTYFRES